MPRAFVCGCSGLELTEDERAFLRDADPVGVIFFKRNIDNPNQVLALTSEIRDAAGRDTFILIDQEGGRVQRLGPPHWRSYPAAARLAAIEGHDERLEAVRLCARMIASDLLSVGIDVDCLPVLDVPVEGAHEVIGTRAYGKTPGEVAELGRAAAEGLLDGGVLPVMKHIPGHGRAGEDSHFALPVIDAPRAALEASDFEPFRRNRDLPAGMTSHVIYEAIDPDRPATTSRRVIETVIRGSIGFDGLLFSDDLSMKALSGTFREKTDRLFAAGVDIALHCGENLAEAEEVAEATPLLAGQSSDRYLRALAAMQRPRTPLDPVDAAERLDRFLAAFV